MHILIGILTVLGAAAFWYYRMKHIGKAAGEVIDTAERMRGAYRRRKFRNKSEGSILTAIEDPVAAAAVMMVSVAQAEGPISSGTETLIKRHIRSVSSDQDTDEEYVFAKWVCEQIVDPNNISMKLAKLWTSSLDHSERLALVDMVRQVASADREPNAIQLDALNRLAERIGVAD
ncbi:MAG: hypothetical protein ACR2OM_04615 [Aestuariivirgaceae bacterium]